MRIVLDEDARALARLLRDRARARGLRVPLDQLHEAIPPRAASDWRAFLTRCLSDDEAVRHLDALARRYAPPGDAPLVVQDPPEVRVHPPRRPDLATPPHTDAEVGNRADQVNLWLPVSEAATLVVDGAPVVVTRGQLLVFDAHTLHAAPAHGGARTRVSVDLRVARGHARRRAWPERAVTARLAAG